MSKGNKNNKNKKNQRSNRQMPKHPRVPKGGKLPCWGMSLVSPFEYGPCHIPDENTMVTCKASSRQSIAVPTGTVVTQTTDQHCGAILLSPFLSRGFARYVHDVGQSKFFKSDDLHVANENALVTDPGTGNHYEGYSVRCTALSAQVTIEGQNRLLSGRVIVGLKQPAGWPSGSASADGIYGMDDVDPDYLAQHLIDPEIHSVQSGGDQHFTATWKPSGVPKYAAGYFGTGGGSFGRTMSNVFREQSTGVNQPALVIAWCNSSTTDAVLTGPTFKVEFLYHWEIVIPSAPAYIVRPTPSLYDPAALATAMNMIQSIPTQHGAVATTQKAEASSWFERATNAARGASDFLTGLPPPVRRTVLAAASSLFRTTGGANLRLEL